MKVSNIIPFIPSKDYQISKDFYEALGFKGEYASDDLTLFENNGCRFFLQRFYNRELADNLVFQLAVLSIDDAWRTISNLSGFNIKFEPVKQERWGKVIFLWGPSGELWQVTEFNH